MIRIIIGPDAIKKEGLDRVTKSIVKKMHKLSTAYLINTSLTSVDMPEAQNLNSFQHDIPNALPNAESLHTN